MADLLAATCLTQIETALRDTVLLALGTRVTPAAADTTAIKAMASGARHHDELRYVTSKAVTYRFDRYSTAADDGDAVLRPTDNPTAGRWLKTTSTVQTGYAKAVQLYEGEATSQEILQRLAGVKPGIVISWDGSDNAPLSQYPGALYDYRPRFSIWCVSSNLRREKQASTGPQVAAESTADPGANRILGDLKKNLAGSTLGQTGVKWCEIGREERVHTSLADRLMVYALHVEVRASVHIPDDDLVTLDAVRTFDVQLRLAELNKKASLDGKNYLVSGIAVPEAAGLTQNISAGSAYINSVLVNYAGQSKVFAASKDTYRDLNPNGTLTFVEVGNGQDEPAVTSGALRIGVTVTNATAVTDDRYIAATLVDHGPVDQVPPT